MKKFISSLFLGLATLFLLSPLLLLWFIHGNYERYVWIIQGPYPFSNFGSGPFQVGMIVILLVFSAVFFGIYALLRSND